MGGKIGDFFTKGQGEVSGTGQSVGDLKGIGYSDQEISSLGGGSPSTSQRLAKGLVGGVGRGLAALPQAPGAGGGSPIQVTPTPSVQTGYDPNYLMNYMGQMKPWATPPYNPSSAFLGR